MPKALVYNYADKTVEYVACAPLSIEQDKHRKAEQNADDWIDALISLSKQIPQPLKQTVQAISVSGQQHGFVPLDSHGSFSVSLKVKNTGKVAGDEIVQLYVLDQASSVTRPVKELKAFYDINMQRTVEPGLFDIMVGSSSENLKTAALEVK